jgi:hypothetical protein
MHILVFLAPRYESLLEPRVADLPFVSTVLALTNGKDSADHAMTMEITRLDMILKPDVKFCLLSADWFLLEVASRIQMLGSRECDVLSPTQSAIRRALSESPARVLFPEDREDLGGTIETVHKNGSEEKEELDAVAQRLASLFETIGSEKISLSQLGHQLGPPFKRSREKMSWKKVLQKHPELLEELDLELIDNGPGKEFIHQKGRLMLPAADCRKCAAFGIAHGGSLGNVCDAIDEVKAWLDSQVPSPSKLPLSLVGQNVKMSTGLKKKLGGLKGLLEEEFVKKELGIEVVNEGSGKEYIRALQIL